MIVMESDILEMLLELVAAYVSDIDMMKEWLEKRWGHGLDDIIIELDRAIGSEEDPTKRTDFRILRNALEKL